MMKEQLKDEIRNTLEQWLNAFNAHDIEALMALYDPEVTYVNSAAPRKIGIPMIKEDFTNGFTSKPKVVFKEEQVIAEERLGYITGQFKMTGTDPAEGGPIGESGRVVVIFRKSKMGEWKLVFDMDNRPPDVDL